MQNNLPLLLQEEGGVKIWDKLAYLLVLTPKCPFAPNCPRLLICCSFDSNILWDNHLLDPPIKNKWHNKRTWWDKLNKCWQKQWASSQILRIRQVEPCYLHSSSMLHRCQLAPFHCPLPAGARVPIALTGFHWWRSVQHNVEVHFFQLF